MHEPRAVIGDQLGPPDNYRLVPHDPGQPGSGQVRIRVMAAGVSFADVLVAGGKYQLQPPTPFIPGSEYAGIVEAVGAGVTRFQTGDRVMAGGMGNAFNECAVMDERSVHPAPESLSFAEAACFRSSFSTSYHALVDRAQLQQGETLVVLAAGGAVGYAAIQIGKAMGARVIGSASGEATRALALKAGADAVIDSKSPTWRDDLKAANDGKPVDVVLDPVGGDMTELGLRSLAWNGRILVVGFMAGIPAIRTNLALLKGASIIGVDIRQFGIYEPEKAASNLAALFNMQAQAGLKPAVTKSYPIEQFADAMNAVAGGGVAGRLVITMKQEAQ